MDNYYAWLGISSLASLDEIKHAYRKQIQKNHPDTGVENEAFVLKLNIAYETLKDPIRRAHYDRQLQANVWYAVGQKSHALGKSVKEGIDTLKGTLRQSTERFRQVDEYLSVAVYPWQALFGDKIKITTSQHTLTLVMPAFTDKLDLKIVGAGLPKADGSHGDLYLSLSIKNPDKNTLTQAQRAAFLALKDSFKTEQ